MASYNSPSWKGLFGANCLYLWSELDGKSFTFPIIQHLFRGSRYPQTLAEGLASLFFSTHLFDGFGRPLRWQGLRRDQQLGEREISGVTGG